MKISKINFIDIPANIITQSKKEKLVFCKNTSLYSFNDKGMFIGFTGILYKKDKAIFKNHYVLPEHRKNGYFKIMLHFSIDTSKDKQFFEATCTPLSINYYLRLGFVPIKYYKNKCVKVIYENIQKRNGT